jgi:hypothetical protein
MLAYVKRTTVKVDDDVDARIRQEAARRGLALSEWVREALIAHLPGGPAVDGQRRTFRAAGAGASGRTDISSRIDELLAGMGGPADNAAQPSAEQVG